ncbi:MAG: hypothetical protein GKR94_20400 [Gammaproteobacteria bacterium]|nr:hypothetical protein [Gammaproteobacteria bacterium]
MIKIGEPSVIDSEPTSAFMIAEEHCRLLGLDRNALWELFRRTPYMTNNLLTLLTCRMRNSNKQYEDRQRSLNSNADDAGNMEDDELRIEPDQPPRRINWHAPTNRVRSPAVAHTPVNR